MKHAINFFHAEKSFKQVKKDLICDIAKNQPTSNRHFNFQLTGCIAQMMVEGGDIGAWAVHIPTREFYFTEKWASALGYEKKDYILLTLNKVMEIVHPEDIDIAHQLFFGKNEEEKESRYNFFLRMKSQSGKWVGMLIRGKTLVYDDLNNPLWMFGVHLDLTDFLQSEMERKELVNKTNNLHQNIPGFLYQFKMRNDGTCYFPFLTEGVQNVYGCSAMEGMNDPSRLWDIVHPEDVLKIQKTTTESAKNMSLWTQRFRIIHPTKGVRWVEGRSTPQLEEDGGVLWSGYIHDDTDFQKNKEEAKMAASVYNNSQEGIIVTDKYGQIEKVNPAFTKITGFKEEELLGKTFNSFCDEFISKGFREKINESLINNRTWREEVSFENKYRGTSNLLLSIDAIPDPDFNEIASYVAIFTDIGQIKRHEADLVRLANYDCLTNLPNRRLLSEKLEAALEHSKKTKHNLAVCFIDLDKFKPINDKYGHSAGDEFLCKLSASLLDSVRSHDTVARLGGDEFVVVLSDLEEDVQMEHMLERIANACSATYCINGVNIEASASIGVVVYPKVDGSADELLRFADQSMYRAKQQGRKRYVYFDQEQENASIEHYIKIDEISNALKMGEISLWYQPKLELETNKIVGVEALVRWSLKDGTIIAAKDFISIIIGDGMDITLGKFVLERALKEQREWCEKGIKINVSINISPDHLLSPNFKEDLSGLIKKYNTDPKTVMIEILETSKISDFDVVISRLQECIELGVSFSLDDFGTGYSSLGYLRLLPVQEVKIDKSFVQKILEKKEDKMIVKGIIDLSHGLDRKVLAEGVESKKHVDMLYEMGIDMVQGYEVAQPMSSTLLIDWMQNRKDSKEKNYAENYWRL